MMTLREIGEQLGRDSERAGWDDDQLTEFAILRTLDAFPGISERTLCNRTRLVLNFASIDRLLRSGRLVEKQGRLYPVEASA